MPLNLIGVDLKLGRAEEHLRFLGHQRNALIPVSGDRIVGQLDADTGDYVVRVDRDPPPRVWGIPISEFAHALRTALDNLLWQLILARGGTPVAKVTQFPINEEEADFNGKPKRKPRPGEPAWPTEADRLTHGISAVDRAFIEDAQPFKARANVRFPAWADRAARAHPLAMLADLNNIDKHRYIHAAYAAVGVLQVQRGDVIPVLLGSPRIDPSLMAEPIPMLHVNGEPKGPLNVGPGPNNDPTEIARAHVGATDADVQVDPPLRVEISLSDRERPMTIFDFADILREVRRIVEHFRATVV